MIGRLRGRVDGRGDGWVLIDVGGVGYMVEGSARMLDNLPGDGEAVSIGGSNRARQEHPDTITCAWSSAADELAPRARCKKCILRCKDAA